jgi:hypothetical protein
LLPIIRTVIQSALPRILHIFQKDKNAIEPVSMFVTKDAQRLREITRTQGAHSITVCPDDQGVIAPADRAVSIVIGLDASRPQLIEPLAALSVVAPAHRAALRFR